MDLRPFRFSLGASKMSYGIELPLEKEQLLKRFFSISSLKELDLFKSELDKGDPFEAMLFYYATSWGTEDIKNGFFNPEDYLASDLSAVMLGHSPVIFMGNNMWCSKIYLKSRQVFDNLIRVFERCKVIRETCPKAKVCLVIVPERDYIIRKYIKMEKSFQFIDMALNELEIKLGEIGCEFVFNDLDFLYEAIQNAVDLSYPDTHLPEEAYLEIYYKCLEKFNLDSSLAKEKIIIEDRTAYGDLSKKFSTRTLPPYKIRQPVFVDSSVEQVSGDSTFGKPLGATSQSFLNKLPLYNESIHILGDSHSSIFRQGRLTYLFSSSFSETYFSWNPANSRNAIVASKNNCILLESSLRFLV